MVEGYCTKCKTKREIKNPIEKIKKGLAMVIGTCPVCETKVVRFKGRIKKEAKMEDPVNRVPDAIDNLKSMFEMDEKQDVVSLPEAENISKILNIRIQKIQESIRTKKDELEKTLLEIRETKEEILKIVGVLKDAYNNCKRSESIIMMMAKE